MVAPKEASTCRSQGPKDKWIERTYDYVIATGSLKGMISQMEVVEDLSQDHIKHYLLVVKKREKKGGKGMTRAEAAKSTARLPGLSTKEIGREEGAVDEDGEERGTMSQIAQGVVACIKEKVSVHDGIKEAVQRPVGQSFMRSLNCSQIENEEEESWRQGDQMGSFSDEEQKMKEILETKNGWKEAP